MNVEEICRDWNNCDCSLADSSSSGWRKLSRRGGARRSRGEERWSLSVSASSRLSARLGLANLNKPEPVAATVAAYGCLWMPMDDYGCLWMLMNARGINL